MLVRKTLVAFGCALGLLWGGSALAQSHVFSPEFSAFARIPEGNLQWSNGGHSTTIVTINEGYAGYDDSGVILHSRQTRRISNVQVFTNTAIDAETTAGIENTIFLEALPAHSEYIPLPTVHLSADLSWGLGYDDGWRADWSINTNASLSGVSAYDGPFVIGRQEIEVIKIYTSTD